MEIKNINYNNIFKKDLPVCAVSKNALSIPEINFFQYHQVKAPMKKEIHVQPVAKSNIIISRYYQFY